jgi:hypothetical protein
MRQRLDRAVVEAQLHQVGERLAFSRRDLEPDEPVMMRARFGAEHGP